MSTRPEHLPDFACPPLDEVVIGVQFSPLASYSSIHANDIWGLFKDNYPVVQEHPPLEPSFETFGGSNSPSFKFQLGSIALNGRLWFVSRDETHLIQFQKDRFLLNWRRRPNGDDYPHFESISKLYDDSFISLQNFCEKELKQKIEINQAEVSYVNIIPIGEYADSGKIFSFLKLQASDLEFVNLQSNEIVTNLGGKPYARFFQVLQSGLTSDGKTKAFRWSFTFRGKPDGAQISDAMQFIYAGREKIVHRFNDMTSTEAHAAWGKIK